MIDRDRRPLACFRCATELGAAGGQPEAGDGGARAADLLALARATRTRREFVDEEVVWRDFCCPGCGVRLATEVAYPGEPPFHELELA